MLVTCGTCGGGAPSGDRDGPDAGPYHDALFRVFPEGILLLDSDHAVLDINPAACVLLGVSDGEALGRKCHELCFGTDGQAADCPVGRALKAGERARAVHELGAGAGRRFIEVCAMTLPAAAGGRVLVVLRDITVAVRSREMVRQKSAELEGFIHALGHDLKAPLANVKGFVELLEEGQLPPEQAQRFLSRVRYNTDVMGRLISDLLELSRIGIREEPGEELESADVVAEVLRLLEPRIRERGAAVEVDPGLPRLRYPRTRLLQVFANLIDNALTHTPGTEGLRIAVSGGTRGGWHRFTVRDNGPGIDDAERGKIFEPFYSRTKKTAGTTGLGLSIVKRIVEKNGGTIGVETAPGQGAAFTFTVPG